MMSFSKFLTESESTLQYHGSLNKKLWDGMELKAEVRKHLLKTAKAWAEFAQIPSESILDVVLTGGNANYNYTDFSDLDVHLIVNKKKIAECKKSILDEYLKDKKTLWSLTHNVKIFDYDVELYAQDIDEPTSLDQGVFSLKDNKWLSKPQKTKVDYKNPSLSKKINSMKNMIDFFIQNKTNDIEKMQSFKDKLKNMRGAAVKKGGEFSIENLAFKELRNLGYLDRFDNYIIKMQDKGLSLKGGKK